MTPLTEAELIRLYDWIDGLPLNKKRKSIRNDFSDARLVAEIIGCFFPKMVDSRTFPTVNSIGEKIKNWDRLNKKALTKLQCPISSMAMEELASGRSQQTTDCFLHQLGTSLLEKYRDAYCEQLMRSNCAGMPFQDISWKDSRESLDSSTPSSSHSESSSTSRLSSITTHHHGSPSSRSSFLSKSTRSGGGSSGTTSSGDRRVRESSSDGRVGRTHKSSLARTRRPETRFVLRGPLRRVDGSESSWRTMIEPFKTRLSNLPDRNRRRLPRTNHSLILRPKEDVRSSDFSDSDTDSKGAGMITSSLGALHLI